MRAAVRIDLGIGLGNGGRDLIVVDRAQIGVVTQDTALLHRSVAENIAYGRQEASLGQVEQAARRANAHEFILELADKDGRTGYQAMVGERGVKLSGGQRQRIAIARMFLKNAPILLLDEATSALDSEVEAAIQENRSFHSYLKKAKRMLEDGYSEEIYVEEIRKIIPLVGQLTGEIKDEDVLTSIFNRFCIGK